MMRRMLRPHARRSAPPTTRRAELPGAARAAAALLAATLMAALPGCLVLDTLALGNPLPAPDAVASVQPGVTTRQEVLHLLGPPDEYRQPSLPALLSSADSQEQRVQSEHEIFDRRVFTWVHEINRDRLWLLWPLYTNVRTDVRVERIVVLFDEHGVVSAVGQDRGEAP